MVNTIFVGVLMAGDQPVQRYVKVTLDDYYVVVEACELEEVERDSFDLAHVLEVVKNHLSQDGCPNMTSVHVRLGHSP